MAYATLADLATHLGVPETGLPSTAQRDLDTATDVIEANTLGRIREQHLDAARRATLAQYDYQVSLAGMEMLDGVTSVSMGSSFSASFARPLPQMATRARSILFSNGLIYRGVTVR